MGTARRARGRVAVATALLAVALAAVAAPAAASPPWYVLHHADDAGSDEDCVEALPVAAGVAGVTDTGQTVSLVTHVVLHFAENDAIRAEKDPKVRAALLNALIDRARGHLNPAAPAFDDLRIKLVLTGWSLSTASATTTDAQTLIDRARDQLGGRRPTGTDVVFVLTDRDLAADGDTSVVGVADCVGGIRYPSRAFAVGQLVSAERLGPFTFNTYGTSRAFTHEVGHLLGAHHHYTDCVEGATDELGWYEPSPCTVMSPYIELASRAFGLVDGAVVRGHAVDFLAPGPQ